MGKPFLPNINELISLGIDPKTGLPMKLGHTRLDTKADIKKVIRKNDEQIAVNRYTWYNLPAEITSQELEKYLYYYGQVCLWYMPELDKFIISKYALDGQLDFYGRYQKIHPIPINSGGSDEKLVKAQEKILSEIKLNCKYVPVLPENLTEDDLLHSAVLLHDYSKQIPQMIIPTQVLNDPVIDLEAECMPFLRTALLNNTGTVGVRVADADQANSVDQASKSMVEAATHAEPYVAIEAPMEFQELTNNQSGKTAEFLQSMQAIDNFRLGLHGVPNGGLFDKSQYVNNAQTNMNLGGADVSLTLQDGLSIRQHFCNVVNSIWGVGIWCEVSENIVNTDLDGDGLAYERTQPEEEGGMQDDSNV